MRFAPAGFHAALFATASIAIIGAASAQTAAVRFDLPSQPLSASLSDVARLTGVDIVFAAGDVDGLVAPALAGEMTARALRRAIARAQGGAA